LSKCTLWEYSLIFSFYGERGRFVNQNNGSSGAPRRRLGKAAARRYNEPVLRRLIPADAVPVIADQPEDGAGRMRKCKAPTLVMAAEKDCLFPGAGVIARAEKIVPDCRTYLLKGRGHMNLLTDDEKRMIVDFLR